MLRHAAVRATIMELEAGPGATVLASCRAPWLAASTFSDFASILLAPHDDLVPQNTDHVPIFVEGSVCQR